MATEYLKKSLATFVVFLKALFLLVYIYIYMKKKLNKQMLSFGPTEIKYNENEQNYFTSTFFSLDFRLCLN